MKNLNTSEDNCLPNLIQSENEFESYEVMIDILRNSIYKLEKKHTWNVKSISEVNENRLLYLLPIIIDCRSLLYSLTIHYQKSSFIDEVNYPVGLSISSAIHRRKETVSSILDMLFERSFNNPHDFDMPSLLIRLNRVILLLIDIDSIIEIPVSKLKNISRDVIEITAQIRSVLKEKAYMLSPEDMLVKESDEVHKGIRGLIREISLDSVYQTDEVFKVIVNALIQVLAGVLDNDINNSSSVILNFSTNESLALDYKSIKIISTYELYLDQTVTDDPDANSLLVNLILIKRITNTGMLEFSNAGFLIQLLFKVIEQLLRLYQKMFSKDVVSLQILELVSNH